MKPKFGSAKELLDFVLIECGDIPHTLDWTSSYTSSSGIEEPFDNTEIILGIKDCQNKSINFDYIIYASELLRKHFGKKIINLRMSDQRITEIPNDFLLHIEGIQFFACPFNQIMSLPKLPKSLSTLACFGNQLTELPELPENLKILNMAKNDVEELPELPKNLTMLDCRYNQLKKLPKLPSTLESLNCSYNELTEIPPIHYGQLENLTCNNNRINTLPTLPPSLNTLNISNNELMELPEQRWAELENIFMGSTGKSFVCFGNPGHKYWITGRHKEVVLTQAT